ncbi:MAG: hypothetical protein IJ313_03815 [Clostridia bacterium]|nr:hypothetical protein [Clostridia bacterium]
MMKKLLCFLAFLFLMPMAYAEEAMPYIPGSVTQALFADAFTRGDMILASMGWNLTFSENASELSEEDAVMLEAISEALKSTTLTAGAGQIEDGVRILLAGQYEKDERQAVLDLTLDLTTQGISVMSSAIPNERFTAGWETLLVLGGMSPEEAAQLLSLRELDVQTLLAEFLREAEAALALIGQVAAPYGETILAHISALPIEVREDVPAEAGFPAAATEISMTISSKALGNLIIALSEQLEADTTLCALLDMVLAESGEEITAAQLCQAVREIAAQKLTDEDYPVFIYIGQNSEDEFLYFNIVRSDAAGVTSLLSLIATPDEEAPDTTLLMFDALTLSPEDEILDGVSLVAAYPQATQDRTDVLVYLDVFADGEALLSCESALSEGAVTTEDALRGRAAVCSLLLTAADGEDVVSMALTTDSLQSETAEGGEQAAVTGVVDVAAGDVQIPLDFEAYTLTEQTQDGPVCTLTSFFRAPLLGVQEYIESYALYTAAYEPDLSTVTDIALETASAEEIEAFASRVALSIENTVDTLIELLPEALGSMPLEAEEAAAAR